MKLQSRGKMREAAALQTLVDEGAATQRSAQGLKRIRDACWTLGLASEVRRLVETATLYRVGPWFPVFPKFRDPKLNEAGDVTPMPEVNKSDEDGPLADVFGDGLEDVFE